MIHRPNMVYAYANMFEPTGQKWQVVGYVSEGAALPCQQQVSGWKICKPVLSAHTRWAVEACRQADGVLLFSHNIISESSHWKRLNSLIKLSQLTFASLIMQ